MPDDYNDRRRESNNYLNRMQDLSDFQTAQGRKRDAVYKAIQDKNWSRAKSELDVPPSDTDDYSEDYTEPQPQRNLTAEFDYHKKKLGDALASARFFPYSAEEAWMNQISAIELFKPSNGRQILEAVMNEFEYAKAKFAPPKFDPDNPFSRASFRFESEVFEIEWELGKLDGILLDAEIALRDISR